jgi:RimJ/RimL family protein N-acetyltransferase
MLLNDKDVKLIPITHEDSDFLRNLRNDLVTFNYFFNYNYISKEKQAYWIKNAIEDNNQINFIIKELTKNSWYSVGTLALQNIDYRNRKAEYVRLLIDKNYRGGGIAYQAEKLLLEYSFNYLNLNKIYCQTYIDNEAVINLHLKTGFKKIGIHKNHIYREGKYIDVQIMEILKEEFIV